MRRDPIETVRGNETTSNTDLGDDGASVAGSAPAVQVRGLTKRYGGDVEALSEVTVEFERGAITGLLGANGAGKTTLLKSILGLVIPTAGRVAVDGVDVSDAPADVHRRVAAVFEGARNVYWRLTARENASLFARLHGVPRDGRAERVDRALETVGLVEKREVPVGELSRGMKQRCALACALVRDAPVLVLDEPTAGLDYDSRRDVIRLLSRFAEEGRRTVLLSSHDMDLIERACDRVVVIDEGQVVADATVAELRAGFATRTCTVTVDGEIAPERVPNVANAFETTDWRRERGETTFEVVLPEDEDVYAVVDSLQAADVTLRSIENAPPDVGAIFASMSYGADDATGVNG